ncbi:RPA-interacting protein A-like [Rhopilema esculentum]|uniref:RPA-interacting protein A-like n=1 Tax=Rhopilema esculentum TaxID=499914 RepID=UPI0031D05773
MYFFSDHHCNKMEVEISFNQEKGSPQPSSSSGGSSTHRESCKRTPRSWKEKFRKACIHRLRQNRHTLVEKLRKCNIEVNQSPDITSKKFIEDLMQDEWMDIKANQDSPDIQCACCSQKYPEDPEDSIDRIFEVMNEIREELMKEERLILQEFNELENFDEKYLCAAIECLDRDYVICPVCKRHQLLQSRQVFFCSCGVRIDTGYDAITLSYVRNQIEATTQEHGSRCNSEAVFSVLKIEELDLHNLVLQCQLCGFMSIVV